MRYISRLYIVVEAEGDGEAADAMSACLTENLKCGGHIVDWAYSSSGGRYDHPIPLIGEVPENLEDGDMDVMFIDSSLLVDADRINLSEGRGTMVTCLLNWLSGWRQDFDGWWVRARRSTDPIDLPADIGFVEEACIAVRMPVDARNIDRGIIR